MSAFQATPEDVRHAYRLLLGREPDEGGYASHIEMLEAVPRSPIELARGFFGSREFIERFGCLIQVPAGPWPPQAATPLRCQACTRHQIESPVFLYWARRLGERPGGLHRKLWEWCFITQALYERDMLAPSRRGLGFAVGIEPLTALFASLGCEVLATDLDQAGAAEAGWVESNQHAAGHADLNQKGLCPAADFAARVSFANADMRAIPESMRDFDFLWSSCAMEHLGSLQYGLEFVVEAMRCLRPGGIAVHTTELNCDSDSDTVETGGSVVYRRRDLLALGERLRDMGHDVEPFDFHTGGTEADLHVDEEPYGRGPAHIKLRIGPFASTSMGLIVRKGTR
jgi:SAM-dependent methyltransferase